MRFARIALHGLMLMVINFGSIAAGFLVYLFLYRHHHPIHVQAPTALAITACGFLLWKIVVRISGRISLMLHGVAEYSAVYCAAFLWTPVLFLPMHSLLTGYVAEPSNIAALWTFQLWANAISVAVVGRLAHWGKHAIEIAS